MKYLPMLESHTGFSNPLFHSLSRELLNSSGISGFLSTRHPAFPFPSIIVKQPLQCLMGKNPTNINKFTDFPKRVNAEINHNFKKMKLWSFFLKIEPPISISET